MGWPVVLSRHAQRGLEEIVRLNSARCSQIVTATFSKPLVPSDLQKIVCTRRDKVDPVPSERLNVWGESPYSILKKAPALEHAMP
jgi:hypothetical protein